MLLADRFGNRRFPVDALALIFGIGAWLGVNSIFVQLPLLVINAPEGWNLPAFMSLAAAIANIGPILYSVYSKFTSRKHDDLLIYGLLAGSTVAIFCLIFLHETTAFIFGADRSTAILSSIFVASFVGCTSSVLFMPYLRNYREIYLVTYLVGEGLSGFLPSIVALIQGVGGNPQCVNGTESASGNPILVTYYPDPRFSTSVFFAVISAILFLSFVAFFGLNYLPISRSQQVQPPGSVESLERKRGAPKSKKTDSSWNMSRTTYVYLLLMMGVVCALGNTGLSSLQSYSCLPYGNVAYHLAVTLGSIALPLAMCIGFVVKNPRVDLLSFLTASIIVLAAFVSYLAVMSPAPPLQHTWIGELIVVSAWVLVNGLVGFVKLGITTIFRPDPGRGLFYTGVATQIGSFCGAVVTFYLVNISAIFVTYAPCDDLVIAEST